MKAPARRSVSYVVEANDEGRAHRLGVNSLAIDPNVQQDIGGDAGQGGVLYSAGRDGVVASWDLHFKYKRSTTDDDELSWTLSQDFTTPVPKTTCKAFSQMHTDWVNDIVLCDNGRYLVSASSDRTVKLWAANESEPSSATHTIGWHTDYVKCLASANKAGWVASGGFDKRINIWDIQQSQEALSINANASLEQSSTSNAMTKASIYAMAVNPTGRILATGSPDKVVRLWDPRSGRQIGKLTGHTDNIRALLVSEDGSHILSGSSDSTIKLWSVKVQRCLATYETHPDSVWSLYSDDPDLRVFYAGSRDGLVTKTEIAGNTDWDGESECVGLFKEKSGVTKIVALQDTYIWTATSSCNINRWLSVPSRETRQVLTNSTYNTEIPASAFAKLPPARPTFTSQYSEPFVGSDNLTLYARSVMSIPISYQEDDEGSTESVQPLRNTPDSVIYGKPGITSHLVLQNRRHVLSQDTDGEIALWDLVRCSLVKRFGKRPLTDVAQEVNGMDSFPAWCSVDTKIGAITVQLDGFTCFDCDMYADESDVPDTYEIREDQRINIGKWVLAYLFEEFIKKISEDEENGIRHTYEVESQNTASGATIRSVDASPPDAAKKAAERPMPKPPLTAITTNIDSSIFNSASSASPNNNGPSNIFSGPFTAPPTTSPQLDYFSGAHHQASETEAPLQPPPPAVLSSSPVSPTGNFINRLKHLSVKARISKSPTGDEIDPPSESNGPKLQSGDSSKPNQRPASLKGEKSLPTLTENDKAQYTPPSLSEFPPLAIPRSTTIIITEESAEASTGMDLYRGTVGSAGADADLIAKAAPGWLLSYLYHNKTPSKDAVKLTFILRPCAGSKAPELPSGSNNRLLANRILRTRKIIHHIGEKLGISPNQAVEEIELLCCDTVLPLTMTLASIKQHIMKSSGDILLCYRYISEGSQLDEQNSSSAPTL